MGISTKLDGLATAILVACAVAATGIAVRRELFPRERVPSTTPTTVRDWETYETPLTRVGAGDAVVKIIVFSDFECPFCARHATAVDSVLEKYAGRVALDFRHFPISTIHKHAQAAALASECARNFGRFKEFHDVLFSAPRNIGVASWAELGRQAGIEDSVRLEVCMSSSAVRRKLSLDSAAASKLGVRGTPTTLINSQLVIGAPGFSYLDSLVRKAISRGRD